MPLQAGDVVKSADSPTIYLGESGELRPIQDTATAISQWNWNQVRTLPDGEVDVAPLGAPYPSVIEPPAYPKGTLLASPLEEQPYVIEDGGR